MAGALRLGLSPGVPSEQTGRRAMLVRLGHILRAPGASAPGSLRAGLDLGGCTGLPQTVPGRLRPRRKGRLLLLRIWAPKPLSTWGPQCRSPGWRSGGKRSAPSVVSGLPPGLLLRWVGRGGLPEALARPPPALCLSCYLLSDPSQYPGLAGSRSSPVFCVSPLPPPLWLCLLSSCILEGPKAEWRSR